MERKILSIPELKTTLELLKSENKRLNTVVAVKDAYEMGLKEAKDLIDEYWEKPDFVNLTMKWLKKNSYKQKASTAKLKKIVSPRIARTMEQECDCLLTIIRDSLKKESERLVEQTRCGQDIKDQARIVRQKQIEINLLLLLKARTEQANENSSDRIFDAHGKEITDGCYLSVQNIKKPIRVYKSSKYGCLCFTPYDIEETVSSYLRNDLVIIK